MPKFTSLVTQDILSDVLIPDLVGETLAFVIPRNVNAKHTELLLYVMPRNYRDVFVAELNGLKEMVNQITDFNKGLYGACYGGHLELTRLMIEKGATNFAEGLCASCYNGHLELARLMVEKGATNFNAGLSSACENNHDDVVGFMIQSGAEHCRNCRY